jgi:nicotinamide-nucleotide adenylyltransferase
MRKRGLYVGRFQPLHLGHIELMKFALREKDIGELIIVIGSAEKSHTLQNPFTAGERFEMLYRTLYWEQWTPEGDSMRDFIKIIPVPDNPSNSAWVATIESYTPKFNIVFTNEPISKRLFKENNYEVRGHLMLDRSIHQGKNVREKMCKELTSFSGWNDDWRNLVPKQVSEYIDEIDGINRIKDLSCNDC